MKKLYVILKPMNKQAIEVKVSNIVELLRFLAENLYNPDISVFKIQTLDPVAQTLVYQSFQDNDCDVLFNNKLNYSHIEAIGFFITMLQEDIFDIPPE